MQSGFLAFLVLTVLLSRYAPAGYGYTRDEIETYVKEHAYGVAP